MSIKLPDFVVPAGGSTEFLIEDKYVRGGLHIVPAYEDLAELDPTTMKVGMLCVTQDTKQIFQLIALEVPIDEEGNVGPFWSEFKPGDGGGIGIRQQVTHFVNTILPGAAAEFSLPLGRTVLVHKLSVDTSCMVEAFETVSYDDTNPFKFIATPDHLVDDGSTLMTDGTVLRGRRYHILSNQEISGEDSASINIYFRVTNTGIVEKSVTMSLSFLPIEQS